YEITAETLATFENGTFVQVANTFDYLTDMIENGTEYYVLVDGTTYVKLQRAYMYKRTMIDDHKKVHIEADEVAEYENYYVRSMRQGFISKPDFSAPEYKDYAYKEYVSIGEIFYLSLDLRAQLYISAGKMYFKYDDFKQLYTQIRTVNPAFTEEQINDEIVSFIVANEVGFEMKQGEYVKVKAATAAETEARIRELIAANSLYVWANSDLDKEYDGVEESISSVLSGIFGNMGGMLQLEEDDAFNLYIAIRVDLCFDLRITDSTANPVKFNIRDLDIAIDVWMQQNDLKADGSGYLAPSDRNGYAGKTVNGSLVHVVGIYYDRNETTGRSGLYVDLSFILGDAAKIYVDLSQYSVEEVLNGMLGKNKLGNSEATTVAANEN
ncbi:MAG: hypothetical protein K2N18_04360, partial [Clostridia bacterium]|nr:hypothetical protein [Clostridia bacterium]